MEEFKVNAFITLRLVDDKTVIYVSRKKFIQCKFLLLSVPISQMESEEGIKSIDEAAEKLDSRLEGDTPQIIPPEVEFWGHCSNLQVWAENDYDSRFLHRSLAFPLLKRLTEEGDNAARKIFKEEIAKRLAEGNLNVFEYLGQEGYLDYLQKEEFLSVLDDFEEVAIKLVKESIVKEAKKAINQCIRCFEIPFLERIKFFSPEKHKTLYMKLSKESSPLIWYYLIDMNFLDLMSNEELISFLKYDVESLVNILNQLVNLTIYRCNTAIAFFFERLEELPTSNIEEFIHLIIKSANPKLLCFIDYIEPYTKSFVIPRSVYYSLILVEDEADIMVKLEKLAGRLFCVREMLEGEAGELIFTLEDHHIKGLLIAGQETLPKGEETKIIELICNLKELRLLDLCYLNLNSLPSTMEKLEFLEELNLQGNRLIKLPEMLLKLKKLRKIDVSDNPMNKQKDKSIIQ